jgi:hypothetical protein
MCHGDDNNRLFVLAEEHGAGELPQEFPPDASQDQRERLWSFCDIPNGPS